MDAGEQRVDHARFEIRSDHQVGLATAGSRSAVRRRGPFQRTHDGRADRDDAPARCARLLDRCDGASGNVIALRQRQHGVDRRVAGRRQSRRVREAREPHATATQRAEHLPSEGPAGRRHFRRPGPRGEDRLHRPQRQRLADVGVLDRLTERVERVPQRRAFAIEAQRVRRGERATWATRAISRAAPYRSAASGERLLRASDASKVIVSPHASAGGGGRRSVGVRQSPSPSNTARQVSPAAGPIRRTSTASPVCVRPDSAAGSVAASLTTRRSPLRSSAGRSVKQAGRAASAIGSTTSMRTPSRSAGGVVAGVMPPPASGRPASAHRWRRVWDRRSSRRCAPPRRRDR